MSSSPTRRNWRPSRPPRRFQSAVAHELFSDAVLIGPCVAVGASFKALSRMSSSPTRSYARRARNLGKFQSAVAHELFSDQVAEALREEDVHGFKALSRMSSSPTSCWQKFTYEHRSCFKALSRMSSSPTQLGDGQGMVAADWMFQSAVAHELFSDARRKPVAGSGEGRVSKRCRA